MNSDLVVCIHNFPPLEELGCIGDVPRKGEVYTITGITRSRRAYFLRGLRTFRLPFLTPVGYRMKHFRPIDDSKIELFRQIDRDIFRKKKKKKHEECEGV